MLSAKIPSWVNVEILKSFEGVQVDGEQAIFADADEKTAQAIFNGSRKEHTITHTVPSGTKALSDEEVNALRSEASAMGLSLDGGKVFRFSVANTRIDRDRERFTKELLDKFANDINSGGRQFLFAHRTDQWLGFVFKAQVRPVGNGSNDFELMEWVFIQDGVTLPNQPNVKMSDAIEQGVAKYVSIRFRAKAQRNEDLEIWEWVYDAESQPMATLTEQTELSAVFLGAQYDAQRKDASTIEFVKTEKKNTFTNMKKEITILVAGKEMIITVEAGEKEITVSGLAEVNEAIKGLDDNLKEARADFENDILNIEKEIEESEGARMTKEQVEKMPFAQLKSKAESLRKKFPKSGEGEEGKEAAKEFQFEF